ncbi:MAG: transposase [Candidatus Gracilibacteria bacterium]
MSGTRQSIRLPKYDYSQNGAYFVTMCTMNRESLFGEIRRGGISSTLGTKYRAPILDPTEFGKIAEQCWHEIPNHYPNVELDAFIVMPNHIHGIICIVGAEYFLPDLPNQTNGFQYVISRSLSAIIRGYKIGVTKGCRAIMPGIDIWQRNFYEYVVRDEEDLNRIREYIIYNPTNWREDEMNGGP